MTVRRIKRGELITADYLNQIGLKVNTLEKAIQPPKQQNAPPDGAAQNAAAEDPDADPIIEPATYIETGRTTSTVQVFDQASANYAEIERIETITFVNGNGESLSLSFKN